MIGFKDFLTTNPGMEKDAQIAYRRMKRRKSQDYGNDTAAVDYKEGKGSDLFKKYHKLIRRLSSKEQEEVIELLYTMNTQTGRRSKEARIKFNQLLNMGENIEEGKNKGESWEDGFKRRVVKTTKPEHKEKGYNWRIKGKDREEVTIKLYKTKPDYKEFVKQMKRVAGHEFGG